MISRRDCDLPLLFEPTIMIFSFGFMLKLLFPENVIFDKEAFGFVGIYGRSISWCCVCIIFLSVKSEVVSC
ncbi:hypothetical protein D3C78_1790310 [compost metagenome]